MPLLAEHFEVFAVVLRGQGRSTWTPGRYTVDNMGNDLVRFIDLVIGRPVIVSGLSSGGVVSAWLSAFAKPGQVVAALYEDPPLFASERDRRANITAYDACYIALAEALECPLLTSDARLANAPMTTGAIEVLQLWHHLPAPSRDSASKSSNHRSPPDLERLLRRANGVPGLP